MKKISKRILSMLLSVIMVISVFTVIPLNATAYDETAEGVTTNVDITSECVITSVSSNDADKKNMTDGDEETSWVAENKGLAYVNLYVPQYYKKQGLNVEDVTKIEISFPTGLENNSMTVSLSESSNGIDFTEIRKVENEGMNNTFVYESPEKKDLSGMTYYRIDLSNMTDDSGENPERQNPTIHEIKVYADVSKVSVRALFKSFKIEWSESVSDANESPSAADFTIKRKLADAEDTAYETLNLVTEHFSYVTYDGYNYYTYLDDLGDGTNEDFTYQVSRGDTVIGSNTVTEDLCYDSMRKNALLCLDYGAEGHSFDGTSADQVLTIASGELSPIRLEKLKKNEQGTFGISFATAEASEASVMDIVNFGMSNNSDKFLALNYNGSKGTLRGEFPGNLAFTTLNDTTTLPLNDGNVHTYAVSTTYAVDTLNKARGWHMQIDGGSYSFDASHNTTSLMGTGLTGIYIGGTPNASSELFKGTIYGVLVSEEAYEHADLVKVTQVRSSIKLTNLLKKTEAAKDSFFTDEEDADLKAAKVAALDDAIDYAKIILDKFNNGTADEDDCARQVEGLTDARNGQYVIRAFAGDGAKAVSLTVDGETITDVDDTTETESDVLDVTRTVDGKNVEVTFTATGSSMKDAEGNDLEFLGWFNRAGALVSTENPYSTTVSGLRALTAKYGGINGVPSLSNIQEINGSELTADADASSQGSNGPVSNAFNDSTANFWMSDNNTEGYASAENPVWIQTGFGGETKAIAAISYSPSYMTSSYRAPAYVAARYNVKVANKEDFSDGVIVMSGTMQNVVTDQIILFPAAFECKYVRLTIYGKQGSGTDDRVSATKFGVYEYLGNNSFDVEVKLPDGQVLGNLNIADENGANHKLASELTSEQLEAALSDANYKAYLDNIKKTYVFDYENYDPATKTLDVLEEDAKYTITADIKGVSQDETKAYGTDFSTIVADETDGNNVFNNWTITNTNNVVAVGNKFNYAATNNMSITANYAEAVDKSIMPYIAEPVYSRSGINHIIEIPVTLNNAVGDDGNKLDSVTDFGIVIAKPLAEGQEKTDYEQAIKDYILGDVRDGNGNIIVSSAKSITLSNKGRYLHRVTTQYSDESTLYAYAVVDGNVILSNNTQTLSSLLSIAEEEAMPTE